MAEAPGYAIAKLAPQGSALGYPNHDRANDIYGIWMSGYTEDEIAGFMGMELEEVKKDLMYVNTRLQTRHIIQHNNERERIMLQRANSENFRRLMKEALEISAKDYIIQGMSPAAALREYREATGLVQKAEPLLQINTQVNNTTVQGNGVQSAEDVIRRVLRQINEETPASQEPIDVEASDPEDQHEIDSDTGQIPDTE